LQHIAYDQQLASKQTQVRDAFARIGRFGAAPVAEVLPSPSPWGYRIKADVHVVVGPTGRAVVGFRQRKAHTVFDVERCAIVQETVNDALHRLRREASGDRGVPEGRLTLWAADNGSAGDRPDCASRTVKGQRFSVPRNGFFQANAFLTETLVDTVLHGCALTGSETVVDAYCGSGLFSVFLPPAAAG
jgi:23S rRNA (uracil1939-C5)-methyltransferase